VIVADASAVIAFFFREENWDKLKIYMKTIMSIDHVVKEFYNAIWKAVYLRRILAIEDAERIIRLFKNYRSKNMILKPEDKYIDEAFKISSDENITIYDALYVAQALNNKMPLLSLDNRQRKVAQKLGIVVLP
jgi:predicted nucleic acid-binding protein